MSAPFVICLGRQPIGYSELEDRDESMGIAVGVFVPTQGYEQVRSVFRLFAEAQASGHPENVDQARLARYYVERDKLDLRLASASDRSTPTSFIHIEDFPEELSALQVTVQLPGGIAWLSP